MNSSLTDDLAALLEGILADSNPLDAFNEILLGRVDHSVTLHDGSHPGEYWDDQRAIAAALMDPTVDTVVVPSGHSTGKTFGAAGHILGWPVLHPDSLVVTTSPSNTQLSLCLWKEIRSARNRSPILSRIGRLTQNPHKFDLGEGWSSIGYATNKAERLQGHHSKGPLLVVVDEASGIEDPAIWATLESLKPRKKLLLSNPLHDHGYFYEMCKRADDGDRTVRKIKIPSTRSPDILQEDSQRGLADARFLRNMALQYGAESQTYRVRVEAEFPDGAADRLIPTAWLDRAEAAEHQPGGRRKLSNDVAEGNGGDDAVQVVKDDNGILAWHADNRTNLEGQATRAALLAQRYGVEPGDVSWDAGGCGFDFGNRLEQAGIVGARPYKGGRKSKTKRFDVLRSACHWAFRRRLDPNWRDVLDRPAPPFAIPREFMARLRKELREVTYETVGEGGGTICVRPGTEVRAALRFSPDFTDATTQLFAFT